MELLDVFDENNNFTGVVEKRDKVHQEGLFHRHVICWIMNNAGEVLLQKRANKVSSNPNKWSRTGGHVNSGESVETAMIRELKEEIGINVKKEELELMSIYKEKSAFGYEFFLNTEFLIDSYTMQLEEVADIAYFTIEEIEKSINNEDFIFFNWDKEIFDEEMKKLKDKRNDVLSDYKVSLK